MTARRTPSSPPAPHRTAAVVAGRRPKTLRRVAGLAAGGCLVVAAFQVALALGAPFGQAAYGGADAERLPAEARLTSALAALFFLLAVLHALSRGGFTRRFPRAGSRRFSWVLLGVCAVEALLNAASSSPWERFGWAPWSLALAVLCLFLARSGRDAGAAPRPAEGR